MHMNIKHPYISNIVETNDQYIISLSSDFPFKSFVLNKTESIGYPSVEANIGFLNEDGSVDSIGGSGNNHEEAMTEALIQFVNLVVHPADITINSFVWF